LQSGGDIVDLEGYMAPTGAIRGRGFSSGTPGVLEYRFVESRQFAPIPGNQSIEILLRFPG
jgi:hypothetical protein